MNSELKDDLLPSASIAAMKCYAPFSKKFFRECLSKIKQQLEFDIKCSHSIKMLFPSAFKANLIYDNSRIVEQLIKVLKIAFKDNHKHSWIDYFIWELDFGKKNKYLKAIDKDGNDIPLYSASDLYNLLIKNMNDEKSS